MSQSPPDEASSGNRLIVPGLGSGPRSGPGPGKRKITSRPFSQGGKNSRMVIFKSLQWRLSRFSASDSGFPSKGYTALNLRVKVRIPAFSGEDKPSNGLPNRKRVRKYSPPSGLASETELLSFREYP
jgi:hypothetical protein